VELAQALAARIQREGGMGSVEKMDFAFRLCLARAPNARELNRLTQLLGPNPDDDRWTILARVLLNLDEFITRE
jgi:hypothetical protein